MSRLIIPTCHSVVGKGQVVEVHKDGIYTVEWTKKTLSSIHPVFKQRCEIDGLDEERYGLSGDDLESEC